MDYQSPEACTQAIVQETLKESVEAVEKLLGKLHEVQLAANGELRCTEGEASPMALAALSLAAKNLAEGIVRGASSASVEVTAFAAMFEPVESQAA